MKCKYIYRYNENEDSFEKLYKCEYTKFPSIGERFVFTYEEEIGNIMVSTTEVTLIYYNKFKTINNSTYIIINEQDLRNVKIKKFLED